MTELLARFFRWNNSRLITTSNQLLEKVYKVVLVVSLFVYRRSMPGGAGRSCPVVIENFDSDLKLRVDRCRAMGGALFWTGFHEFREFQFLHKFLKPEMNLVDVGANLGEYTLFASKRLTHGKVFAFEPLNTIRKVLEENIQLNALKNIQVFPYGLSSREEMLTIHEFRDVHEGLATFFPGERESASAYSVPLKKMDDVINDLNPGRIDLVKIDIEGGELGALQGCRSMLARFRPVFMVEINAITYRAAGYTVDAIGDFFTEFDYEALEIRKRGELQVCKALPEFGNIVFKPR